MSATEIRPLPTLADLLDVEQCLSDSFAQLEQVVLAIRDQNDRFAKSSDLDPSANYDYLGRVFECLCGVEVQLEQLQENGHELGRQAQELAAVIRHHTWQTRDA